MPELPVNLYERTTLPFPDYSTQALIYWKLNESSGDLADSSGNGYTGAEVTDGSGGTLTQGVSAWYDKGIRWQIPVGTGIINHRIATYNPVQYDTKILTISVHFKGACRELPTMFFGVWFGGFGGNASYLECSISTETSISGFTCFFQDTSGNTLNAKCYVGDISFTTWNNLVVTINKNPNPTYGDVKFWVNGVLKTTTYNARASTDNTNFSDANACIFRHLANGASTINQYATDIYLDDWALFNRELTQTEIDNIRTYGVDGQFGVTEFPVNLYSRIKTYTAQDDANTVAFLEMEGVDGGNTFVDSASLFHHTVTVTNNAITDTDVKKFGVSSLYIPWFTGSSLSINQVNGDPTDEWSFFGTNGITVECWFNREIYSDVDLQPVSFFARGGTYSGVSNKIHCAVLLGVGDYIQMTFIAKNLITGGDFSLNSGNIPCNLNTWYHIGWTYQYSTGIISIYFNNQLVTSGVTTTSIPDLAGFNPKIAFSGSERWGGWTDNWRFSNTIRDLLLEKPTNLYERS